MTANAMYEAILGEVSNLSRRAHLVDFFRSDTSAVQSVCEFVFAGLSGGEAIIVIARPERNSAIKSYLRGLEVDVDSAISSGQFTILDAHETLALFMNRGRPTRDKFMAAVGSLIDSKASRYPLIRAYGEMVDILGGEGNFDGAIELEEFWNELAGTRSFSLLCGYSESNFRTEEDRRRIGQVCACHTHALNKIS